MSVQIKVEGDRRRCSVSHEDCAFRACLWVREDPGSYSQGRGYRYDGPAKRRLLCGNREARGCPDEPKIDETKIRCCRAPDFTTRPGDTKRCRTCGTRMSGRRIALASALPKAPAVKCAHAGVEEYQLVLDAAPAWRCPSWKGTVRGCGLRWDAKPEPHQPGEDGDVFNARRLEAWLASIRST